MSITKLLSYGKDKLSAPLPKKRLLAVNTARLLVQLLCFFLISNWFVLVFNGIRSLAVPFLNWDFQQAINLERLLVLLGVILVTLIAGRFFCGWMCAYGFFVDLAFLIQKKTLRRSVKVGEKLDRWLRFLKYVVLAVCVVFIWRMDVPLLKSLSPWDAFGQLFDIRYIVKEHLISFIIMAGTLVGSFFIERFFCRYLCPVGAALGLVSKLRVLIMAKSPEKCGSCSMCTSSCPMGIKLKGIGAVKHGDCINCARCTAVCPKRNMKFSVFNKRMNPVTAVSCCLFLMMGTYLLPSIINSAGAVELQESTLVPMAAAPETGIVNENSLDSGNSVLKDGVYTGEARGYKDGFHLVVTIEGGRITKLEVGENNDDYEYIEDNAPVLENILENQTTTGVDAVSGATKTGRGIMNAFNDAIVQAGGEAGEVAQVENK